MAGVKLAIDFGSIDTNIYLVGSGLVLSEPTVATVDVENMGEINGIKFMRKFYNYYISSTRNASKYRSALVVLDKEKEIESFTMEAVANEVIISLFGANIKRGN